MVTSARRDESGKRLTVVRIPLAVARRIDAVLEKDGTFRSRSDWIRWVAVRELNKLEGRP